LATRSKSFGVKNLQSSFRAGGWAIFFSPVPRQT
jgi:hypothetical protein